MSNSQFIRLNPYKFRKDGAYMPYDAFGNLVVNSRSKQRTDIENIRSKYCELFYDCYSLNDFPITEEEIANLRKKSIEENQD